VKLFDLVATQLLEDHLHKLGTEGTTGDDESAWHGWEVESDSSDGSENETWIDVDDDAECLDISDVEDEPGHVEDTLIRISTLATTKVRCDNSFNFVIAATSMYYLDS
jgi:protein SDA1